MERMVGFAYAARAMSERSRALEYCPGIGRPFGFTKCEMHSSELHCASIPSSGQMPRCSPHCLAPDIVRRR